MPPVPAPRSGRRRRVIQATVALGLAVAPLAAGLPPARGAELLEVRIDTLQIPIPLDQLDGWSRGSADTARSGNDLAPWLGLLDGRSRSDLQRILRTPLLKDRSFGRQLLDTWAGGQLLSEVGNLLTTPDGRSTTGQLQITLRRLLERGQDVTVLDLLEAIPSRRLNLQLDGLLSLGQRWRLQLERQRLAMVRLRGLPLPRLPSAAAAPSGLVPSEPHRTLAPQRLRLAVPGRAEGVPLEIWLPEEAPRTAQPWLLMMPGLGGNADQLAWLATALSQRGWPVVVLQHPGSDAQALKASLSGQRPPPGAETIAARLADLEAVVAAQRQGRLPVRGNGLVIAGHSLGGLTALLAAGVAPFPGLEARCRTALERLPLHNPSRLIQCQLPERALPRAPAPPADLRGLILFNGFGSLLWPEPGLATLPVPLLMVGGSLDLVTPPLDEQLPLFLGVRNPRSRLVVVNGGSHFSPVRVAERDEALLRLGRELVGVDPVRVQGLLLALTEAFLRSLEPATGPAPARTGAGEGPLPPQRLQRQGVMAFVMDPEAARRWRSELW